MIGQREACEIATVATDAALRIVADVEGEALLSLDAINAYNNIDRQSQYELICELLPDMVQYFKFLYDGDIVVDFDAFHRILMSAGNIQGLTTSQLFYSAAKWRIQQKTEQLMIEHQDGFAVDMQTDYIDDGWVLMHARYLKKYIDTISAVYMDWDISINIEKSVIVMSTESAMYQQQIAEDFAAFRYNFEGNLKYLGVPHGTDTYINGVMRTIYQKLQKKALHIALINNAHIKQNLFRRFMDYNKIIYHLKCTRKLPQWLNEMETIYSFITAQIMLCIKFNPTRKHQLPLTQKRGGLGLRSPLHYHAASSVTALSGKWGKISSSVRFEMMDDNQRLSGIEEGRTLQLNHSFYRAKEAHAHKLQTYVDRLNEQIGPKFR